MRWSWTRRDYTGWIEMWGRTGGTLWSEMTRSRVWIQGMGKHVMFREPNCCIRLCLCNILYCIVKSFSLIHGRRHGWPNHIKTSCTICVIVLSLYSWTNIVGIKAFAGITSGIRAWVEDFWKSKRSQSTQDENKRNFHWRWSRLLFRGDMIQKGLCLRSTMPTSTDER